LENFLEGYAKVALNYIGMLLNKFSHVTVLNINGYRINILNIILSLYKGYVARINLRTIDLSEIRYLSSLQILVEELLGMFFDEDIIFIGWRPYLPLPLSRRAKILIIPAYSHNYFKNLLKYLKFLSGTDTNAVILNPYLRSNIGRHILLKQYPPINPLFFEIGHYMLNEKSRSSEAMYRLMGRLHPSRGYRETIIAFKRFKDANPSAKARLVIDSFSEDSSIKGVKRIRLRDDIDVVLWNPLREVKSGLISPADVLSEVAKKYVQSSYVLLPYTWYQFIEPPLTLLEALATGSFVVASDIVAPFVNNGVVYEVKRRSIIEDLTKAFEYLYEIYDSDYYWSARAKAYEYALRNLSSKMSERVLGEVLG
jgi:glycosyltransferase involved in cell wall biosynthesis